MDPLELARKPNVADAVGASEPFHVRFLAVTVVPLCVTVAFQDWVICWPPVKLSVAVQPDVVAAPPLRTLTSPWKPLLHWLITR